MQVLLGQKDAALVAKKQSDELDKLPLPSGQPLPPTKIEPNEC